MSLLPLLSKGIPCHWDGQGGVNWNWLRLWKNWPWAGRSSNRWLYCMHSIRSRKDQQTSNCFLIIILLWEQNPQDFGVDGKIGLKSQLGKKKFRTHFVCSIAQPSSQSKSFFAYGYFQLPCTHIHAAVYPSPTSNSRYSYKQYST